MPQITKARSQDQATVIPTSRKRQSTTHSRPAGGKNSMTNKTAQTKKAAIVLTFLFIKY